MKNLFILIVALLMLDQVRAQCENDTIPPTFTPYPPDLITVSDLDDLQIPEISSMDNCSESSVSYILAPAQGCQTAECYVIEWTAIDDQENVAIAFTFVEVLDPLSVPDLESDPFSVYPNPSSGRFTVTGSDSWKIFDQTGRQMDPDQLDPGTYFIRDRKQVLKLIIQ